MRGSRIEDFAAMNIEDMSSILQTATRTEAILRLATEMGYFVGWRYVTRDPEDGPELQPERAMFIDKQMDIMGERPEWYFGTMDWMDPGWSDEDPNEQYYDGSSHERGD